MRNYWIKFLVSMLIILQLFCITSYSDGISESFDILVGHGKEIPILEAGTDTFLPIYVENLTHLSARNMIVSVEIADMEKTPFEITNMNAISVKSSLGPKEKRTIDIPVKVSKTAEAKVYSTSVEFKYESESGSGSIQKTAYFKVTNDYTSPNIELRKTTVADGAITAGKSGTVTFDVYNDSDSALKDIKVHFKDLASGALLPVDSDISETISTLNPKKSQPISFNLLAESALETKSYVHTLDVTFKDEADKSYTFEKKVYIPVRKLADQNFNIGFVDVNIPASVNPGKDFNITFALSNNAKVALENVSVKLETEEGLLSKSAAIQQVKTVASGTKHGFSFKMFTKGDIESKNYPLKAVVTYDLGNGTEQKTYYEYLNVFVDGTTSQITPKLIVSNYSFGGSAVKANQPFNLNMTFLNTNKTKPIYNVKITLAAAENVFTPATESNSFFIDSIPAQGKIAKTLSLIPDFSAKPKNYPIEVKMDYEDEAGKAYSMSDSISVSVAQDMVPRISKTEIPPNAILNTPNPVSVSLFNIGKAEMRNIFVSITGDNITDDQGEVYLGNLGEGSETYYDGSFTPTVAGEQSGKIIIKYQDDSGKEFEMVKDFTVTVDEMPMEDPMMGMEGELPEETPAAKWIGYLKIVGIIVLVALIGFGIFKFWKKRKERKQVEQL